MEHPRAGSVEGSPWLRLGPAAARLGISRTTLRQWADAGRIRCSRTPGGHRRFRVSELDQALRAQAPTDPQTRPRSLRQNQASDGDAPSEFRLSPPVATKPSAPLSEVLSELIALLADVTADQATVDHYLQTLTERLSAFAPTATCEILALRQGRFHSRAGSTDAATDPSIVPALSDPSDSPLAAQALDDGESFLVARRDDPRLTPEERESLPIDGGSALLGVPLVAARRAVGLLRVLGPADDLADALPGIETLSRLAARVLSDADSLATTNVRAEHARALADATRRLTTSLDARDIAASSLKVLPDLVSCHAAACLLAGTADRPHAVTAAYGVSDPEIDELQLDGAEAGLEVPLPFDGSVASLRPADLPESLRRGLAAGSTLAGARLAFDGRSLGYLVVAGPAYGRLTTDQEHLLSHLAAQVARSVADAGRYHDVRGLHLENLRALNSALGARDAYSLGHAARVAAYMVLLADELAWPDRLIQHVEEAAFLHDIGKLGVDERVLVTPTLLSSRDWESVYLHPKLSAEILEPVFDAELVAGVRHHHERWDGTGYPDGLAGDAIPRVARAMAVVDAYDAMSCRRPYRDPLDYSDCRRELLDCSGSQFDPRMADVFLSVLHKIDELRSAATRAAAWAAERIDPKTHRETVAAGGESASASRLAVADILRASLRHQPLASSATTVAELDGGIEVVVEIGSPRAAGTRPQKGSRVLAADYATWFRGRPLDQNVLSVNEHGCWVTGTAPVVGDDGAVVALANVDIRAAASLASVSGQKPPRRSFAAMLHTTAERLGRARQESITDHLTGLYNHRYLQERLAEEIERARECGSSLSLLFLDLDRFKDFNDRYGHSMGDRALRAVADAIDATVRGLDLAARYGGEEFVVILVDTDGDGAMDAAERIRRTVARTDIADGVDRVTVSIGVASFPDDAERQEGLIDKADWAMYAAKRGGRDCVRSFSGGQLRLDLGDTERPTAARSRSGHRHTTEELREYE